MLIILLAILIMSMVLYARHIRYHACKSLGEHTSNNDSPLILKWRDPDPVEEDEMVYETKSEGRIMP
jgi:hypothetical protein